MAVTIEVKIEDKEFRRMMRRFVHRTGNLAPAMKTIGEIVRTSVIKNFEVEGRPRWKKSKRAALEGGQTLTDTARLRKSIFPKAYSDHAEIGTNVVYAAIHQFGGGTRPHTIRPRDRKALYWPGAKHPVKSVRHPGSKIPARPFLVIQDEDWTEIKAAVTDYLTGGIR